MERAYEIVETLSREGGRLLRRAVRRSDDRRVLLETIPTGAAQALAADRLRNDLEIGRSLERPHLIRSLALESIDGSLVLVRDDVGADPLTGLLGDPLPIETFLDLARSMALALEELHEERVVHRDVKPDAFLADPDTGKAWLFRFGLSSRSSPERPRVLLPDLVEGSLPYISPEQTGRMNRPIDGRSDLYSLGITFFQMLVGRLPFEAADPGEWIHLQVASPVPPPATLSPHVPDDLSRIVVHLTAKMPEERYQTAAGLRRDLEDCKRQWKETGRIELPTLGASDVSARLQLPQRLFGRDEEKAILEGALEDVASSGKPALTVITGASGVGKSSLVHGLLRPLASRRGIFLSGKFDSIRRGVPYSTIAHACREALRGILGEPEETLASWRRRLAEALGENGQILVELLPELEAIVGPQEEVSPLPYVEARKRFMRVFSRFLQVFATREHPVVLFLDDLQWSDPESLELLEHVLSQPDAGPILVACAWREQEVGPSVLSWLGRIQERGVPTTELGLGPLEKDAIEELLSAALLGPAEEVRSLAGLVLAKTGGNPFFALQFLSELVDDRLLRFDPEAHLWRWDLAAIERQGFTENVVELLASRLGRLPEETRDVLRIAACMGHSADLRALAIVMERPGDEIRKALQPALEQGLMTLRSDDATAERFRFVHDRIQHAAYRLLPEDRRAQAHLRIGRLLLQAAPREEPGEEEGIFELAAHFNLARELLGSDEKLEAARLDLAAGRRAMDSSAFATALDFFSIGSGLLPEDAWERHGDLAFPLHLGWANCAFLTGDRSQADELLEDLKARARGPEEIASVATSAIYLHTIRQEVRQAVEVALDALQRLGLDSPVRPTSEQVDREHDAFEEALGGEPISSLLDLPRAKSERVAAIADIVRVVAVPAFYTDLHLMAGLMLISSTLNVKEGNPDAAAPNYAALGMAVAHLFGRYRKAYDLGKLGRDLVDRRKLEPYRAQTYILAAFTNQWREPLSAGLSLADSAFVSATRTGDLTYACYVRCDRISLLLAMGVPLPEIERECLDSLEYVAGIGYPLVTTVVTDQLRLVKSLRGDTESLGSFDGEDFSEADFDRELEAYRSTSPIAICWHWIRKQVALVHAARFDEALDAAEKAQELIWTSPSFTEVPEHHFHRAMALAGTLTEGDVDPERFRSLREELERFRVWAEGCKATFGHRHDLLAAEVARLEDRELDAVRAYDAAILGARENRFLQDEALAFERSAAFTHARGFAIGAELRLREARRCYRQWGADGKVRDLEERFPALAEAAPTAAVSLPAERLDWMALAKAAQAISKEVDLPSLLSPLVRSVLEQGGARRACFVFLRDGEPRILAEATLAPSGVETRSLDEPLSPELVPTSIVQLVLRTGERVVIGDAIASGPTEDEYFVRRHPRSVLCLPILRKGEAVAALYLENDLVAGAFSSRRLAALELLAGQAAISVEASAVSARELADRKAAEAEQERTELLDRITASLSGSLDLREQSTRLVRAFAATLADGAIVFPVDEEGTFLEPSYAIAPELDSKAFRPLAGYRPYKESRVPAGRAVATGESVFLPEMDDDTIREYTDDETQSEFVRSLGVHSLIASPMISGGRVIGAIVLVRFETKRPFEPADLELLEELAQRAAFSLDNARLYNAAQAAIRLRDDFVSIASHELRTPLTSLQLIIQRLEKRITSMTSEQVKNALALAGRQIRRLIRLVGRLLDVGQVEAGKLQIHRQDFDLGELVEEAVDQLADELARADADVRLETPKGVVGSWDEVRIGQVVTNLLTNAIKFGRGSPIEIEVGQEDGIARIDVTDHGPGIAPEIQERLFRRFSRGVSSRHYGGMGLGLYVSRRIVEAHGGSIGVESEEGEGARFTVELPVEPPAHDASSAP
ncbi:AAA family ATPase [Vulgatibacter incomptus]|uniref:histidine kinase n=1 Tax=Vulgatibacter incomptus TaxID=1391653 RepID=A0A0K1PF75_9BACT|nr:AAA family ATPase [Vulgatibacter incomptus]AKU92076.1 Signal transduction histidine kinase CheA [Vulgatibacter incomptus]